MYRQRQCRAAGAAPPLLSRGRWWWVLLYLIALLCLPPGMLLRFLIKSGIPTQPDTATMHSSLTSNSFNQVPPPPFFPNPYLCLSAHFDLDTKMFHSCSYVSCRSQQQPRPCPSLHPVPVPSRASPPTTTAVELDYTPSPPHSLPQNLRSGRLKPRTRCDCCTSRALLCNHALSNFELESGARFCRDHK